MHCTTLIATTTPGLGYLPESEGWGQVGVATDSREEGVLSVSST